ncbi:MAG: aldehyde ferredoxin oxidoreductase [Chloroflexi bacterium]|nr:aldehyde ferredoxin oxidoreductase [Chloroflexota bacterium]
MAAIGGYRGKILRIDLSTGKISSEDTAKYKDFLGGTGLGYKILWDEVKPGTKAWDPENRIIFGVGPLTGSGSPLSGRVSITTLFPVNINELPGTGHMGGHWGAELKFAGWDSVIVQGKAPKPVWIYINDDKVEIRDAKNLWGNGIFRATEEISNEVGSDVQVAAIGQAGENLVRVSCVLCNRSHSAGGVGSVLGSKNLKAIGVKGTGSVAIAADKKVWKEFVNEYLSLLGANNQGVVPTTPQPWAEYYGATRWNAQKGQYWGAANPPVETGECSADDLNRIGYRTHKGVLDHGDGPGQRHHVRSGGCYSCPIRCHVYTDIPALETKYGVSRFNGNTCVGNSFGRGFFDNITSGTETAIEASQLGSALADDYGLWNDYGQFPRDLLYAYRKGILKAKLDPKEYDSIPWKLLDAGDPAFLLDIMKRITFKQGELGKLFADGPAFLEKKWSEIAEYHQTYESSCWKDAHAKHHSSENGGQVGTLINMMYNRDSQNHTHSNYLANGLPLALQKEIGAELFGSPDAIDANNNYKPMNKGKAVFTKMSLIYLELHNSLTACNWTLPVWASPRKDRKYRGDVAMEAKALSHVTGEKISREEIEATGMRILHLFRALTARFMNEKDMRNKHDLANKWVFDYPADKQPFTAGHSRMDRADIELAKDLFYEEMGWDKATGMPTRATLEKAGLKYVADELAKQGLIA